MPPPDRPRSPTGVPGLEWLVTDDGSHTLWTEACQETFHSGCGAVAESLVVYLGNSGVADRLRLGLPTRVLELGFGTATAFLLTAAMAENHRVQLHYTGLENQLLPASLFQQLHHKRLPQLASDFGRDGGDRRFESAAFAPLERLIDGWIEARQRLDDSQPKHTLQLSEYVQLELLLGDARQFLVDIADPAGEEPGYHAVYFDPFSPLKCPELWTQAVFGKCFASLQAGGKLTSYCVKGAIRRELAAVGFDIQRQPGPPGGKREVLVATKPRHCVS